MKEKKQKKLIILSLLFLAFCSFLINQDKIQLTSSLKRIKKSRATIINGDFEEEIRGWQTTDSCELGTNLTIETETDPAKIVSGKQSLKITADKNCGLSQKLFFEKGKKYQIQVELNEISGKAKLVFKDAQGKDLAWSLFNQRGQFQTATIPVNGSLTPEGTLEIIVSTTRGQFIVDRVQIKEKTKEEEIKPSSEDHFYDDAETLLKKKSSFRFSPLRPAFAAGGYSVQPIYFVPGDMEVHQQYIEAINYGMSSVRSWYQGQMGTTFNLDALLVWHDPRPYDEIRCGSELDCLNDPERADVYGFTAWDSFSVESGKIKIIFGQGAGGWAGGITYSGGTAGDVIVGDFVLEPLSGFNCPKCISPRGSQSFARALGTIGHELGHAFDLPHPSPRLEDEFGSPYSIMGGDLGSFPNLILYDRPEYSEKERLRNSPFFGFYDHTPSDPIIEFVEPREAVRGGLLEIYGSRFCPLGPGSDVFFGETAVAKENIRYWSDNYLEIIIPPLASGLLKVRTSEACSSKVSNSFLLGLFDKEAKPLEIISFIAEPHTQGIVEWRWKRIVGNFDKITIELSYKSDVPEKESTFNYVVPDVGDIMFSMPTETARQLEFGDYEWRVCAYNYFEQKNYCQNGFFALVPDTKLLHHVDSPAELGYYDSSFDFSGWTIWENGERVEKVEFYTSPSPGKMIKHGEAFTDQFDRPDLCELDQKYCRAGWKWHFDISTVDKGLQRFYIYPFDDTKGHVGPPVFRFFLVVKPTPTQPPPPETSCFQTCENDTDCQAEPGLVCGYHWDEDPNKRGSRCRRPECPTEEDCRCPWEPKITCQGLNVDKTTFRIGETFDFAFDLEAVNTILDKVYVLIGSEERDIRLTPFSTDVCQNKTSCHQRLLVTIPEGEKSETLLTVSDLKAWLVAKGQNDRGTCTERTPTGFGSYPACNHGRCQIKLNPISENLTPTPTLPPDISLTPTPTLPPGITPTPLPGPTSTPTPSSSDQFPIVQEPLTISLGETKLSNGIVLRSHPIDFSLQAHLKASDDQKIEKIFLHLKKEGESNWRELAKIDCQNQQGQECLFDQSISLPANLEEGNYLLVASVWDHPKPTDGQHFGTTGAQFKDSDCLPSSSYCYSPLLRFNFKVESITCSQFKERDGKTKYAPGEELNFEIEVKTNNNISLETAYVKIGEKGAQAPTLSFESNQCQGKTSCSLTIPASIPNDYTAQSLLNKNLQAWVVAKTITSQTAEPVSCSDIENRTGPSQDYPVCGCARIDLVSN